MNNAIHDAFINALLAEASYVNGLVPERQGADLASDLSPELTAPLAAYVGQNFTVLKQVTETGSGFSVTVFQDRPSGQKYISFRGTEGPLADWVADADIFLGSGVAYQQIKAMVNWSMRASTPVGAQAVQLADTWRMVGGQLVFDTYLTAGTGEIAGSPDYIVNGHSLGGHLTTAFARLFGNANMRSFTFNGCGFRATADSIFSMIERSLGMAASAYPGPTRQTNIFAEHGVNIATNDSWTSQFGQRVTVFNEEGTGIPNHQSYKLTDALALCDVMGVIDNNLSLADANKILNAGAAIAAASLETVLDAMRRLFRTTDTTPTLIGDAALVAANRVDYYLKLAQLRGLVEGTPALRGTIISVTGRSATDLAASANSDIAYRYALKELNPFAVTGNSAVYVPHNNVDQLDLYNAADRPGATGALTSQWITDRAEFLALKNIANTNDVTALSSNQTSEMRRFIALPQNINLSVIPQGAGTPIDAQTRRLIFGGDSSEALIGGINSDRLYGGGGTDYLKGGRGSDYLEGGTGLDIYEYNGRGGFNSGNDGADIIRDIDGKGVLRYTYSPLIGGLQSTVIAEASDRRSDTEWRSADGKFTYVKSGADLVITINADAGGAVTLRDFRDGDFGIYLRDARANPQITLTITGDLQPQDFDPLYEGYSGLGLGTNDGADIIRDMDYEIYGNKNKFLHNFTLRDYA